MATAEKELKWSEQHRLGLELAFLKAMARPEPVAAAMPVQAAAPRPAPQPAAPVARPEPAQAPPAPKAEARKPEIAPEPEPIAAPEAVSQEPSGPVGLVDIQRSWSSILTHLKKGLRETGLEAMVREGHPVSLDGGVLTIGFSSKYGWHQNKTQQSGDMIARAVQDITGAKLRVVAQTLAEESVAAAAAETGTGTPEPTEHPLLNDVMNMFDGKLVPDDNDPWKEE
jgi:DNA polymerase-3 subunit gamma/tau